MAGPSSRPRFWVWWPLLVVTALVGVMGWSGFQLMIAAGSGAGDPGVVGLRAPGRLADDGPPGPEPGGGPSTRPPAPLPGIAPDSPHRLVIAGVVDAGFDDASTFSSSPVSARSEEELTRLADRGSPGSPGLDTVVLVGELRPAGAGALGGLAGVRSGDRVELETGAGHLLTYTVRTTRTIAGGRVLEDPAVAVRSPGRLVLIGVRLDAAGNRLPDDLVVVAQLTGARPA